MLGRKDNLNTLEIGRERFNQCKKEELAEAKKNRKFKTYRLDVAARRLAREEKSCAKRSSCGSCRHAFRAKGVEYIAVTKQRKENIPEKSARHSPPQGYIEIVVELPRGSMDKTRRTFWVPSNATAGTVKTHLATHFRVRDGSWNLYTSETEGETPKPILNMNTEINRYSKDKNEKGRLYFYPEVLF